MGIKEIVNNERITNQPNYALTVITTAMVSLSAWVIQNPSLDAIPYLVGAWIVVFAARTYEKWLFNGLRKSNKDSREDTRPST